MTLPPLHGWLTSFGFTLLGRADYLLPVLLAGLLLGEPFARLLAFPGLRSAIGDLITRLGRKLNRTNRSIATRLYRGIIAVIMLLVPAIALGLFLMRRTGSVQLLATLLLVALIGALVQPYTAWRQRRAANRGTLALQSIDPPYLFADSHGQLRYLILRHASRFNLLVGSGFWFLLADLPGLLAYLMLAAAAAFYAPIQREKLAFGWAASALFKLLNIMPRCLSGLLCWLAAFFTPRTHPFAALGQTGRAGFLPTLLGLSLGGPMPSPAGEVNRPWAGSGNPKPIARDFSRLLQLLLAATLLLLLAIYGLTLGRELCAGCVTSQAPMRLSSNLHQTLRVPTP